VLSHAAQAFLEVGGDRIDVAHITRYTDYVRKNLTLTIEEDLLRDARRIALDRDTSVNELVRNYLGHLVRHREPGKATAAALKDFWRTHSVTMGKRSWTRDELHDRR
jgi:hypothetical protein